jgi:hypothetical protein
VDGSRVVWSRPAFGSPVILCNCGDATLVGVVAFITHGAPPITRFASIDAAAVQSIK